jgi:diadenosine tetraphosphate (Ap4A) HIT family hydrolase
VEWPERWYAWRAGHDCPSCAEGRPDELASGDNVLGNWVPHLHTHLVPRYADDPRPGWPFPFPEPDPEPMPHERLARDVALLRAALAG